MGLRRSDSVFLLTLVDFLVQIIFFGLLVFVFYNASQKKQKDLYPKAAVQAAIDAAGVSNIVELNDELSKLAPVRLKGLNDRLQTDGSGVDLARTADAIEKVGGAAKLPAAIERLAKFEQGSGKPPCIYEMIGGKKQSKTLAVVVGTGSSITFVGETPDLATLLGSLKLRYADVRSLSLGQFRRVFGRVLIAQPNCRYTLEFRETTRLVDARDAAGGMFNLKLRRQRGF